MLTLNHREVAGLIWLCILLCFFLYKPEIRKSVASLIRNAMAPSIIKLFFLALLYVTIQLTLFASIEYWSPIEFLKPATLWFILVAIPTLSISITHEHKTLSQNFFNWLKNNLKFLVFLEFLIGLRTFSLALELVLLPIITILVLASTLAEQDKRNRSVKALFDACLTIIGAYIIFDAVAFSFNNIEIVATSNNAKTFFFGPIMSLLFMPFSYLTHIFVKYESVFRRIDTQCPPEIINKIKLYCLLMFRGNSRLASSWATSLFRKNIKNFDQALSSIKVYKSIPKRFVNVKATEKEVWSPYLILPCLNDYGLTAFLYEPYLEDDWGGETTTINLGNSNASNKVSFRVDGNEFTANRLRLNYNAIYDTGNIEEQLNLVLDMTKTIANLAIDEQLSDDVIHSILNVEETIYYGSWFNIEVEIIHYQHNNAEFNLNIRFNRCQRISEEDKAL